MEARDSGVGGQQRVGKTILQINVIDVNDNAPEINVDFIVDHKDHIGKWGLS